MSDKTTIRLSGGPMHGHTYSTSWVERTLGEVMHAGHRYKSTGRYDSNGYRIYQHVKNTRVEK